ncbi:uncharacterized protein LOC123537808 [Mercenaria mercenaria]|uniref:uncharacterized protein LOC123537808 n=1 Tax=Mercenaria mercenaria TaxID=6596 RepID=UPI00234E4A73|nr:uncharacterized protein LOC123537808 [Mercenaria mercenaria]
MEFSDISKDTPNTERNRNTHLYENTTVTRETIETDETKSTDQIERDEENYEQLNLNSKANNEKRDSKENTQNRNKIIISIILGMLVLLYIAVIVLIVIVALPKSQVNGRWSAWSSWASCSVSCDVGIQHRNRSCSNPYPSGTGHHCFGKSVEDKICLPAACSDGGWSSWESWGTCSATCGGGIRTQTRTCTNPKPSLLGKSCDGTPIQVSICNKQTCPDSKVAFTAYGISGISTPLVFPQVFENHGNGYNNSTGKFTCKIPGIYIFSFQISKQFYHNTDLVQCFLRKNSVSVIGAIQDPYYQSAFNNDLSGYSLSLSGTFHLNINDTVNVGQCSGISTVYPDYRSSFTGVLVTPDN